MSQNMVDEIVAQPKAQHVIFKNSPSQLVVPDVAAMEVIQGTLGLKDEDGRSLLIAAPGEWLCVYREGLDVKVV